MQETGHWELSEATARDVYASAHVDDPDRKMRPGWWLVPSAALGSLSWVGIFYLIFW